MKNVLQKLEKVDSRIKCLMVVAIAYVFLMIGIGNVDAINTLEGYTPSMNIYVQDGTKETVGYLVKEGTVDDVLNQLGIELGNEDSTSIPLTDPIHEYDTLTINRITYRDETKQSSLPFEVIDQSTSQSNISGTYVSQDGIDGVQENTYRVKYLNDCEVDRELVSQNVVKNPVNQIIQNKPIGQGTTFTGRLTVYGGDCAGCTGRSASGVSLNGNGVNNSHSAKMLYQGNSYYALAADPSIPFGTIIEIRNHNLTLEPVIYGIVVDRGGAIKGNKIDIFCGMQNGQRFFGGGTSNNTQFKIVSMGSGRI